MPNDENDFDLYIALKYLLKSGSINVIDTAINYRCQKAERTIGAVLRTLLTENASGDKGTLKRDEIFVSTKNGYVPDDSDAGINFASLLKDLKEQGVITDQDVASGTHCMHPNYLEYQLRTSQ